MFQCGKRSWSSQSAAKRAARWMRDKGERVHAYLCDHCHFWHLGH
jgi:hypothetical protein